MAVDELAIAGKAKKKEQQAQGRGRCNGGN
jgi:hypothetical protein